VRGAENGTFRQRSQARRRSHFRRQKPEAIFVNNPVTSVPIVRIAANAAIEMMNATIAYSTTAAPARSSLVRLSAERISKACPDIRMPDDGRQSIDEW
jgi:hypothetical protein